MKASLPSSQSIERRYSAVVSGLPKAASGTVDAWLARSPHDRKKVAIMPEGKGKRAVTHWELVRPLKEAALVQCRLETGRTHQIRVHLASIGHGLVGDPVYGRSRPAHKSILRDLGFVRQALHAEIIGFVHPVTGEALKFQSPIPSDIQQLLNSLSA
jgi:23S rRNA pseudouridine1911/1915/1917 synthase